MPSDKKQSRILVIDSCNQKAFVCFDEGETAPDRICPNTGKALSGFVMHSQSSNSCSFKAFAINFRQAWALLSHYAEMNGMKIQDPSISLEGDLAPDFCFRSKNLSGTEAIGLMRFHTGIFE